ncbi:GNAT family N-acetyltransferase [Peribacillus kribbensis]|uniref:GNAT family N-acetyltransferase n=1 Tax=Peribacillus kribbensis TaxID=356658 RepID=UPI0006846698
MNWDWKLGINNQKSMPKNKFLLPYAILYGDKTAGFLMYNSQKEEFDGYWIYRIMVDKKFQGKGI